MFDPSLRTRSDGPNDRRQLRGAGGSFGDIVTWPAWCCVPDTLVSNPLTLDLTSSGE